MSPYAPARPCTAPGCGALVQGGGRCDRHRREEQRRYNQTRGSSTAQGYGSRWQKARAQFLAEHPMCNAPGCGMPATVVDHIKPHKGDQALAWDQNNWQGLCVHHHAVKTATSDGRWQRRGAR